MISIHVDEEKVREMAETLAREPKTWDDLAWSFAETDLRLHPALEDGIPY